jgi:hypothetical protein
MVLVARRRRDRRLLPACATPSSSQSRISKEVDASWAAASQRRTVPSALPVTSIRPSVENATALMLSHSPTTRDFAVARSHTRILLSKEQAATLSPVGEKARQQIHEQFFPRTLAAPVRTLHKRTISSQLPEATLWPSGENATELICRLQRPRT